MGSRLDRVSCRQGSNEKIPAHRHADFFCRQFSTLRPSHRNLLRMKPSDNRSDDYDIDTVRRWLGQKTLAMAIHYSETADTSKRMIGVMQKFDPLGSKSRT